jgi:hypothetical protein
VPCGGAYLARFGMRCASKESRRTSADAFVPAAGERLARAAQERAGRAE